MDDHQRPSETSKQGPSEAIRSKQAVAIRGPPWASEVIRGHPRSSEVIRGHPRRSDVRSIFACDTIERARAHEDEHKVRVVDSFACLLERLARRRLGLVPDEGGHQRSSEAIRGHQRPSSEAISGPWSARAHTSMGSPQLVGHQRSSEVIRGHQRSSEWLRTSMGSPQLVVGHQRSSEVIRGHQRSSVWLRTSMGSPQLVAPRAFAAHAHAASVRAPS